MPLGMFKSLYSKEPSTSTINHSVQLLYYNKQEIKQLGTCKVLVRYRFTVKPVHFYVASNRLKPIIGVSDALNPGLTSFHCLVYNNWHDKQGVDVSQSIDSIQNGQTEPNDNDKINNSLSLTKESIVNHDKYTHLFTGIGRFKCKPVVMYILDKLKPFEQKEHFFLKEQNGLGWNLAYVRKGPTCQGD